MLNPSLRPLTEGNASDKFATEVLQGLSRPSKTLPCRFFYDAHGSELFERIKRLQEYYPTRTETAILRSHADAIACSIPPGGVLIEFGSGSNLKTEILLERLPCLGAYVPIDVSQSALADARRRLAARFHHIDIRPIVGDFSYPVALPGELAWRHKTGFLPGSTIGNLTPIEASRLRVFRAVLSSGGRLVVGVDLKQDAAKLVRAYDDRPRGREHPHRELLQVFGRPVPRPRPLGQLAPEPGVDGPARAVQRARAGFELGASRSRGGITTARG